MSTKKKLGFFAGPLCFLVILCLPLPTGLKPEALKVAAVVILMGVWWLSEAIPIPATALLPIVLFPALGIMSSKAACAPYANHLVYLFVGGFFIATAMVRWNLHRRIALHIIQFVGGGPARIILGFMLATAILSMWISNTATTMMMVPIGIAVIQQASGLLEKEGEKGAGSTFATALMLGIAYSASIGGVATIIGTPANTVMVGLVEKIYHQQISFASWIAFGLPLSLILLFLTWLYLVKVAFPIQSKTLSGGQEIIHKELEKLGGWAQEEIQVLVVFSLVAICWLTRGFIHIESLKMVHDSTIAMGGAIILFLIPSDFRKGVFLLDWKTAVTIPWGIIILFGGGLTLASGFRHTGLDQWIGTQLAVLQGSPLWLVILSVSTLTIFLTEMTSNTATATMMVPIMGSLAIAMHIHPYGPIFAAAIAASFAFMLPVATPPNAIVFGSGKVTIPQMAKTGFTLNIIATFLVTAFIIFVLPFLWKIDISVLPAWAK